MRIRSRILWPSSYHALPASLAITRLIPGFQVPSAVQAHREKPTGVQISGNNRVCCKNTKTPEVNSKALLFMLRNKQTEEVNVTGHN